MAKDAADVMTAARALDERMKIEVDAHMRAEREIDGVEVRLYAHMCVVEVRLYAHM